MLIDIYFEKVSLSFQGIQKLKQKKKEELTGSLDQLWKRTGLARSVQDIQDQF